MRRLTFSLLAALLLVSALQAEILPPLGLYDPLTMRSTTTGDPYPVFPPGVNEIPPLNPDRVDQVDQALTILIHTPDIPNVYGPTGFDSLLYSVGQYPTGSMNEYFLESSYGVFGVEGMVSGWYTAQNNYSFYTSGGNYGMGNYPYNAQKLVEEAVMAADEAGVDFSPYDNDGDGMVDGLIIVHQGPGAEYTGSLNDIWSHRWGINPIMLDGVWVSDYSMNPELEGNGSSGLIEPIAVFAHEYTHLLGLPDLYDYDDKLVASTFTTWGDANDHPVNDWCLMGYNGYGLSSFGKGDVPPHLCGYFKMLLGWAEVVTLGLSQTGIELPEVETTPILYKIPINGSQTEYFLLENRWTGNPNAKFDHYDSDFSAWFNWFTPGRNSLDSGLVIYHIDETMPLNDGTPDYDNYGCRVIDAGYTASNPWPNLEFTEWWHPYEFQIGAAFSAEDDQDALTPTTDPSSNGYDGPSGIAITNISNAGPVVTFDLQYTTGTVQPVYAGMRAEDEGGDDDGFLDMGESGDVYLRLLNTGSRDASGITGVLTSSDPYVTVIQGQAAFEDLGVSLAAENLEPFQVEIASSCPAGYVAPLTLDLTWTGGSATVPIPLEAGWDRILFDNMENDWGGWTHGVPSGNYRDQWHRSTRRNHTPGGQYAWKCGATGSGGYAGSLNAALTSIQYLIPSGSRMSFWHRMNVENGWDGGILEIGGGSFFNAVPPEGGYPDQLEFSWGNPLPQGTPCWSRDFDWTYVQVDLTAFSGVNQIRFRFGADWNTSEEGWYIDDLRLYGPQGSVGVEEEPSAALPSTPALLQNYPNPFNPETALGFKLPAPGYVSLRVYDTAGREVATLVDGWTEAGVHEAVFDGTGLASGLYFARMQAKDYTGVLKMMLIK